MAIAKFGAVSVHTSLDSEGFAVDVIADSPRYAEDDWTAAVHHARASVPAGYRLDWSVQVNTGCDRWSAGYIPT